MVDYTPKNVVATFVDQYGDTQIIHRPKGRRLSVFKGGDTPALRMNRAAAILIGQRIKAARLEAGLSQKQLCLRAGLANVNPKQYIHGIEAATRTAGCRMGTIYALAHAMGVEATDLLPTMNEVMMLAKVRATNIKTLAA